MNRLTGWVGWAFLVAYFTAAVGIGAYALILVVGAVTSLTWWGDVTAPTPPPITVEAPAPTATATPTPTPAPTIQPPSGMGSERVIVAAPPPVDIAYADWYIVTLAFPPAEQYRALRTSWCESQFVDNVRGDAGEMGRFQIMTLWLDEPGVQDIIESWFPGATGSLDAMIAAMEHPHVNAQIAAWILENNGNGWKPWTTRHGCAGWQG